MPVATSDETWMREALILASQGLGLTSPNPPVGAVVLLKNEIINRGWYSFAGGASCGSQCPGRCPRTGAEKDLAEATLYVAPETLHSPHVRTPPRVEAILAAGAGRIVVASTEPNPAHGGERYAILRRAGVEVLTSGCEGEGDYLIRFFAPPPTPGLRRVGSR